MSIRCSLIDEIIVQRALKIIQPAQIEIAFKAVEELQQRNSTLDKQWQMKIERVDYNAQLAQRRYEEVDPSNRLVAATLEKKWNGALHELEKIRQEYKEFQNTNICAVTAENREKLLALAKDFPRLWNAKTTKAKDRKRMLRLLIKDITVDKEIGSKKGTLHIRWQGGATEDIPFTTPPPIYDQYRYSDEIINKVRTMASSFNNHQIAESLNQEGKKPSKGNLFTNKHIQWIRYAYKIPAIQIDKNETTFKKQTVGGAL
jgi:hypothetical protein